MDIHVGDVITMKKAHPCGKTHDFLVLRVGMDFKIKCAACGHEVMLPRAKCEKSIKKVTRCGEALDIRSL
ncbi:MAG: DUF951 domain-containing protein [Acutalibacteraceae bacterium]